jgi:hypothetical protein
MKVIISYPHLLNSRTPKLTRVWSTVRTIHSIWREYSSLSKLPSILGEDKANAR